MAEASIGPYRLLELIAGGGMARVFRAEDTRRGREVALKMLRPELAVEREWVERFRAEAGVLARLDHPNIVRFHEFLADGGRYTIAMEYAPGETLAEQLPRHPDGIPWRGALALIVPVLAALEHTHRRGIVHRDLTPANLVISADGAVKLMDFGIARVGGSRGLTRTGFMAGTLKYMSPEQIQARDVDGRSDLYSAALVLYELLCGRPAFDEPTDYALARAQVEVPPPPLRPWRPDVPPRLEELILRALGKEPAERFGSAREFRSRLEAVQGDPNGTEDDPARERIVRQEVRRPAPEPTLVLPVPIITAGRS